MTFPEILREFDIPFSETGHRHVMTGWIGMDCPDCSPGSRKFKLGYNVAHHFCSCWSCGYKPVIKTLVELTGQTARTIREMLGELSSPLAKPEPVRGKLELPRGINPGLLTIHRQYLRGRGFNPTELENLWGLRGIGLARNLAWRIFIPIHLHGKIVSWTTRGVSDDSGPRYISARPSQESVRAKTILYGEDNARHAVVVCEGPTDCWRIGPGAVATLGIGFSREQILRIGKFPSRAVCFDSEPDARVRAKKLCEILTSFPGKTCNIELDAADPGSASEKEIKLVQKYLL